MPSEQITFTHKCFNRITSFVGFLYLKIRSVYDSEWKSSVPERLCKDLYGHKQNEISDITNNLIWIHAASVGEVKGISPLINLIIKNNGAHNVLITTTSTTGRKTASDLYPESIVRYLPIESSYAFKKFINYYTPKLLIVNETEIWPNMYYEAYKACIPVIIMNARLSDKAFPSYLKYSFFFKPVLNLCEFILAQSHIDRERFIQLGIASDKIQITGSSKYDTDDADIQNSNVIQLWNRLEVGKSKKFVWTAGSVREKEEDIILSAFKKFHKECPEVMLIIAPRHPGRFGEVENKIKNLHLSYIRRSQLDEICPEKLVVPEVLLLDTLGELLSAYSLGEVSFVGGTLCPIGGHNILEPACFSKPVFCGPYTMNVRFAVECLKAEKAYIEVSDENDILDMLRKFYNDPQFLKNQGRLAGKALELAKGATIKNYNYIKQYIVN